MQQGESEHSSLDLGAHTELSHWIQHIYSNTKHWQGRLAFRTNLPVRIMFSKGVQIIDPPFYYPPVGESQYKCVWETCGIWCARVPAGAREMSMEGNCVVPTRVTYHRYSKSIPIALPLINASTCINALWHHRCHAPDRNLVHLHMLP
jgi:hypothetical protein